MATYNVKMPDGTVIENVPEGTSKEELLEKYTKHISTKESDEPELSEVATGFAADVAISTAGNVAGAALAPATLGLSYPILSFASGVAGNLAAQELEGRDSYSWGRAIIGGIANVLPGGKAAQKAASGAKITKELVKQSVKEEAKRGAALGAGEAVATSVIDEGDLPSVEKFVTYTAGGTVLGGALGRYTPKMSQVLSRKTPAEIDAYVATGSPDAQEEVADVLSAGIPKAKAEISRKISNQVNETETEKSVGMLTEPLLNASKFLSEKTKQSLNQVLPQFTTGRAVNDIAFIGQKSINATRQSAEVLAQKVDNAIKADPTIEKDITNFINDKVLTSKITDNPDLHGALLSFDDNLKNLQRRLVEVIDTGHIKFKTQKQKVKLLDTINKSIREGYTTTQYKIFTDPNFKRDPKQRALAIEEMARAAKTKTTTIEQARVKAQEHLASLEANSAQSLREKQVNYTPKLVDGILKTKKFVGVEEAKYLGRLDKPADRIQGTLSHLGDLVIGHENDRDIINALLKSGQATNRASADLVPLNLKYQTPEQTQVFVSPELATAVNTSYTNYGRNKIEDVNLKAAADLYNNVNTAAKGTKVLLNPSSYPINFYGSLFTAMSAGMAMPLTKGWAKGGRFALSDFKWFDDGFNKGTAKERAAFRADILEMQSLGLGDGNVLVDDIRNGLNNSQLSKGLDKVVNPLSKAYQVTDTAMRYSVFKHQQSVISKFYPDLGEDEIKRVAALVTNDVYQQYAKIPSIFRLLSKAGGLNPFVAFSLEFSRNMWHQSRYAKQMTLGTFGKEFGLDPSKMSANQKGAMRREGFKRVAMFAAVSAGSVAAVKAWNTDAAEYTPEQQDAVSSFLAPWDENQQVVYVPDKDNPLKGKYANSTYTVPHTLMGNFWDAAWSDKPISELGNVLSDTFAGTGSIVLAPLYSAVFNNELESNGKRITNEVDGTKRFVDKAQFVAEELFMPGFVKDIERWKKLSREQGDYSKSELLARGAGFRMYDYDVKESAPFKVKPFMQSARGNYSSYLSQLERNETSPIELEKSYQEANRVYNENLQSVRGLVLKLNTLFTQKAGMKQEKAIDEITKVLNESGVSGRDYFAIMENKTVTLPRQRSVSISDRYDEGLTQYGSFSNLLKNTEDVALMQKFGKEFKRREQDKILGKSEADKKFASMSSIDKASRIMGNPNLFNSYLSRGLITDDVMLNLINNGFKQTN